MRSFRHWTPRYVTNRIAEIGYRTLNPGEPWLTPAAIRALEGLLLPTDAGIEFGSGRSTLWFAKRVRHLTSIEHNQQWYERVVQLLKEAGLQNVTYHFYPENSPSEGETQSNYVEAFSNFSAESVDFVLVDGIYRDQCAYRALSVLKPGGLLIIDNVNWFLPCSSDAPNSRTLADGPMGEIWTSAWNLIRTWRKVWTTSGVTDTAIFIKPT